MMDQNGMTPLMWAAYRTHRCVYLCMCVLITNTPESKDDHAFDASTVDKVLHLASNGT